MFDEEQMEQLGVALTKRVRSAAVEATQEVRKDFSAELQKCLARADEIEDQIAETHIQLKAADVVLARAEYDAAHRLSERTAQTQMDVGKDMDATRLIVAEEAALRLAAGEVTKELQASLSKQILELHAAAEATAKAAAELAVAKVKVEARKHVQDSIDRHDLIIKEHAESLNRERRRFDAHAVDWFETNTTKLAEQARSLAASRAHITKAGTRIEAEAASIFDVIKEQAKVFLREEREAFVKVRKELYEGPDDRVNSDPDLPPTPALDFQEAWLDDANYNAGAITLFQGSTWLARRANTGERPYAGDETAPWAFFAGGGMGGGFSNAASLTENDRNWPADINLYGARGASQTGWHRAERLIANWAANTVYYATDKVVREPLPGEYEIWDRLTTGVSNPLWTPVEQAEWRRLTDQRPPIVYSDTPPPPELNRFWIETDTWQLHIGYADAAGDPIWVETGRHGSRPGAGSSDVPAGGLRGEVLQKASAIDGDMRWGIIDGGVFV